jgi:uncharacterized protein (DUF58 family)
MWRDTRGPGWRARRRLRFTREGRIFVLTSLGVGVAAINTGSNMLYLVLGVFLALIIVSGVLSEWMLWHVSVRRMLPARVFAGQPYVVEIELRNQRGAYPIIAVEVEDLREGAPADKRCFFLRVPPEGSQVAAYRRTTKARGPLRFSGFRIVTRFPFGFFEKSVFVDAPEELLVYPALESVRDAEGLALAESEGERRAVRGGGHESLGFREGTDRDALRDVAWKLSARGAGLVAHERGAWVGAGETIVFEDPLDAALFERELTRCASLLVHRAGEGSSCSLLFRGDRLPVTPGSGLDEALSALARALPTVSRETPPPGAPSVSRETIDARRAERAGRA